MKPFVSAEQAFQQVRKLPICGSQLINNTFEWPSQSDLRLITLENLQQSKLKKIEYHVGGSLWSMRITMSDGRQSPIFGTKNVIDAQIEFDPNIPINEIHMLSSEQDKYVNAIRFNHKQDTSDPDSKSKQLAEIVGIDQDGHWH